MGIELILGVKTEAKTIAIGVREELSFMYTKSLMSYVPKKYMAYVKDFHREWEEGYTYWLSLECDGKYHLVGYDAEYTIHEDTIQNVLNVLRKCIEEK